MIGFPYHNVFKKCPLADSNLKCYLNSKKKSSPKQFGENKKRKRNKR